MKKDEGAEEWVGGRFKLLLSSAEK